MQQRLQCLSMALLLLIGASASAQSANVAPKVTVRPIAPVHVGKATQFEIFIAYESATPPAELKLSSDKGFVGNASKIAEGQFTAVLFVPPFQVNDEYKVSFAPKGQAAQKRSLIIRPGRYAVPEFMPSFSAKIEPERVVLGRDKKVRVLINLGKPDGAGYTGANLLAEVNTGQLTAFEHLGNGLYSATYTPPDQQFPDVAMIVVQDVRHGLVEVVPIPMWGYEDFPVDGRPNSEIRLIVGAETFGPVTTNFRGVARIPIVVAPGVKSATQLEKLPDGKTIRKVIDLATPPVQLFHGAIIPSRLQAGDKAEVHVFTTPLKREIEGGNIALDLEAEQGKFEITRQLRAGHHVATFLAPKSLDEPATDVYVIENFFDRPEELLEFEQQRAYLGTLEFFPGFPRNVVVRAAPARLITKKPPKRVYATVEVIDPHGNPVPNVEIAAELPGAKIGPIDDIGDGTYKVGILPAEEVRTTQKVEFIVKAPAIEEQIKSEKQNEKQTSTASSAETSATDDIPRQIQGKPDADTESDSVTAAKAQPKAQSSATFEMKLAFTEPGRIRFIDAPRSLAGGNRERRILFEVLDKENVKLAGEEMAASASRGDVVSLTPLPDGNYALVYRTPERGGSPALITVREKTGQISETIRVEITQPFFEVSLLPAVGYILNTGFNKSPRIMLKVDLMSHQVANGRLGLQLGGSFYGRNRQVTVDLGNNIQDKTKMYFWITPLHMGLISYLPVPKVDIHTGLTFNYYLVSTGQIPNTQASTLIAPTADFLTAIGAEFTIRTAFKLGPGKPFIDLSYGLAELSDNNGATGDIAGFSGLLGYMFSF